ncbi:MAG: ferredoxin [Rhodobacter sp.]|uniref:ferredoxin n=1 Tax=Pararhodobacter sp. TaxID=2127056 RepID=UPI001D2D17E7|nr:ferredoxin [Pararhodobacter sp.]MCB1345259.1 ferredoxin [Paracoccaceae bacterium]MCC0073186.1 ferredoxin [Rhodobacter sp.]HPD91660.1 ferredoxin [Pararhodobacter sp.]
MPTIDPLGALCAEGLLALAVTGPDADFCPPGTQSLVLVGPEGGTTWWSRVTAAPEWHDGAPDPLDRWSKRVLGAIAERFGGTALFPSDGPPWPPFFRWALDSGRLWQSPVGMLVHHDCGLWASFRGALALPLAVHLPPAENPCDTCVDRPCTRACPVAALSATAYDTARCHAYLDSTAGRDCMTHGCAARRACPAGESHARLPEQSAYHMSRFHR